MKVTRSNAEGFKPVKVEIVLETKDEWDNFEKMMFTAQRLGTSVTHMPYEQWNILNEICKEVI